MFLLFFSYSTVFVIIPPHYQNLASFLKELIYFYENKPTNQKTSASRHYFQFLHPSPCFQFSVPIPTKKLLIKHLLCLPCLYYYWPRTVSTFLCFPMLIICCEEKWSILWPANCKRVSSKFLRPNKRRKKLETFCPQAATHARRGFRKLKKLKRKKENKLKKKHFKWKLAVPKNRTNSWLWLLFNTVLIFGFTYLWWKETKLILSKTLLSTCIL